MWLITHAEPHPDSCGVVLLFGSGLVGHSILSFLAGMGYLARRRIPLTWTGIAEGELAVIERATLRALEAAGNTGLAVVWAAGKCGFDADASAVELEVTAFRKVHNLVQKIARTRPHEGHSFHLVSSAGGLFEGQLGAGAESQVKARRPYAFGKLAQEALVRNDWIFGRKVIYRPSSIYGFAPAGRRNLIAVLMRCVVQRETAHIVGSLSTLRDYVFVEDVGRFVCAQIQQPVATNLKINLLASGRPRSVFEIIRKVERFYDASLYVRIDPNPNNSRNTSFLPSMLPEAFCPTPLDEGISKMSMQLW